MSTMMMMMSVDDKNRKRCASVDVESKKIY